MKYGDDKTLNKAVALAPPCDRFQGSNGKFCFTEGVPFQDDLICTRAKWLCDIFSYLHAHLPYSLLLEGDKGKKKKASESGRFDYGSITPPLEGAKKSAAPVLVPETVVFRSGRAADWFFNSSHAPFPLLKKRHNKSGIFRTKEVYEAFKKRLLKAEGAKSVKEVQGDCAAMYVYFPDQLDDDTSEKRLAVEYLDLDSLNHFLLHRQKNDGILQFFPSPPDDHASCIIVEWTPYLKTCELRKNIHNYHTSNGKRRDVKTLLERCRTFDAPTHEYESIDILHLPLGKKVQDAADSIAMHVQHLLPKKIKLTSATFVFRNSGANGVQFAFCPLVNVARVDEVPTEREQRSLMQLSTYGTSTAGAREGSETARKKCPPRGEGDREVQTARSRSSTTPLLPRPPAHPLTARGGLNRDMKQMGRSEIVRKGHSLAAQDATRTTSSCSNISSIERDISSRKREQWRKRCRRALSPACVPQPVSDNGRHPLPPENVRCPLCKKIYTFPLRQTVTVLALTLLFKHECIERGEKRKMEEQLEQSVEGKNDNGDVKLPLPSLPLSRSSSRGVLASTASSMHMSSLTKIVKKANIDNEKMMVSPFAETECHCHHPLRFFYSSSAYTMREGGEEGEDESGAGSEEGERKDNRNQGSPTSGVKSSSMLKREKARRKRAKAAAAEKARIEADAAKLRLILAQEPTFAGSTLPQEVKRKDSLLSDSQESVEEETEKVEKGWWEEWEEKFGRREDKHDGDAPESSDDEREQQRRGASLNAREVERQKERGGMTSYDGVIRVEQRDEVMHKYRDMSVEDVLHSRYFNPAHVISKRTELSAQPSLTVQSNTGSNNTPSSPPRPRTSGRGGEGSMTGRGEGHSERRANSLMRWKADDGVAFTTGKERDKQLSAMDRREWMSIPCWLGELSTILGTLETTRTGVLRSKGVEKMLEPILTMRAKKENPLHRHFAGAYGKVAAHQLHVIQQLQAGADRPLEFPRDSDGNEILPHELALLIQDARFSSKRVCVCEDCFEEVTSAVFVDASLKENPIDRYESETPMSWYWRKSPPRSRRSAADGRVNTLKKNSTK